MRSPLLALVAAPLLACDPALATNNPDGAQEPEPQQQDWVEQARAAYLKKVEDARRDFEADKSVDSFGKYCDVVKQFGSEPARVREGVDVGPHEEQLLNGSGRQFLDRLQADYAKKKQRTPELVEALKKVHTYRAELVLRRRPDSDSFKEDGIASLALGYHDAQWQIGDGPWVTDLSVLEELEKRGGRKAVHQLCRAALDRVLADDRRDKARQYYVFESCVLDYGDWETDLAAWASAKETKEFRKAYAPIYAEAAAEVDAIEAERAGKKRANARGEAGSDKPLVLLINNCDKRIRLVIGEDPGSAGARKISLMADEQMNERIKADQRVWLVDDRQKAIAHATVSRYTSELEFTCTSVSYH